MNLLDRRRFLGWSAATIGMLGVTPDLRIATGAPRASSKGKSRKILILGGTGFIGPFQVRYALDRGHEVTLFNRGRTNRNMFPEVETLIGDRNGQLDALKGRNWDVVIDNSRASPDWVRMSAELLKDAVGRYFYVSSRSAYADTSRVPMTADVPSFTYETAGIERGSDDLPYGLAKALSEREAQKIFVGRTNIVRPGLIIGPGDETDRFTYWPVRIDKGGEVLAPGDPSDPVQIIDVRDLTEWMIRMAEGDHVGVFNGVGPFNPRPMAQLLYGIRAVTTAETRFTWVNREFLTSMGLRPYSDLPVWRPPTEGREGFARFDLTPEVAAGLTFRSLAVTAADTLEYHFSRSAERQAQLRAGISLEQETEVLAAWNASGRSKR